MYHQARILKFTCVTEKTFCPKSSFQAYQWHIFKGCVLLKTQFVETGSLTLPLTNSAVKQMSTCMCSLGSRDRATRREEKKGTHNNFCISAVGMTVPALDHAEVTVKGWWVHLSPVMESPVCLPCEVLRPIRTSLCRVRAPIFHFQHRRCLF